MRGTGLGVLDDQDIRAVCLTHHRWIDHVLGAAAGEDLAAGEQVDGVAEQGGQAEIVQRGQHGDAERGDEFQDLYLVPDVQMVGWLVQDQVIGALGDGPALAASRPPTAC